MHDIFAHPIECYKVITKLVYHTTFHIQWLRVAINWYFTCAFKEPNFVHAAFPSCSIMWGIIRVHVFMTGESYKLGTFYWLAIVCSPWFIAQLGNFPLDEELYRPIFFLPRLTEMNFFAVNNKLFPKKSCPWSKNFVFFLFLTAARSHL